MKYHTNIFPYWHYHSAPEADGAYLIYFNNEYYIALYTVETCSWWFPGSHLCNNVVPIAWQDLPSAPKKRG